jgi:nitrilase
MRLALYQGPPPLAAPSADAREAYIVGLTKAAATAASFGADLLVTPEMSTSGYNIGDAIGELAEPRDGAVHERLSAVARANDLAIVYGYPERARDMVFNALRAVDPAGRVLADYRKCHLFGDLDRGHFAPGDDAVVQFVLGGARIGLLTCYDVEFPETVRAHALAGADIVVVPTGLMTPYDSIATVLLPARAMENQVFVVYVNRCGTEGDLTYCGSSCVVGPDGRDVIRAGKDEALLYADIEVAALARSRAEFTYLADRRPVLYTALTEPHA